MNMAVAIAQGAKFSVNSIIGCNPFTVVVTDMSGVNDTVNVNYTYAVGLTEDTIEYHTYNQPGIYRIIQTVANANPRQDTIFITVINQYPPEFFLFNCKGNIGSVLIRDTLYQAYEIDWGDGNTEISSASGLVSHMYAIPGTFDVTVKGLINGAQTSADHANLNCFSTTKRLNLISDIQAADIHQLQIGTTDAVNGEIELSYNLAPDNNYLVEIKAQNQASFTIVDTINTVLNPTSYILKNLNTADNYYCVSITAFDPCDGDRKRSNIACSINLKVFTENNQNRINWRSSTMDFSNYIIEKDGVPLTTMLDQNQAQYIDTQVTCGQEYIYRLHMTENNGFVSISDAVAARAVSTDIPGPIQNISATVVGQQVEMAWPAPASADMYLISRSIAGQPFALIDTLDMPSKVDEALFTQSTRYHYDISYLDACGNKSPKSIVASPILLEVNFDKSLTWSAYEGWSGGVMEYILEKYDDQGQFLASLPMGAQQEYRENIATNPYQFIVYKVKAIANDPAMGDVVSNELKVIYLSKVVFPNAFSPNGDGQNDIFLFASRYISAMQMNIYNRWGELIFQSNSPDQGWDGTIKGKAAPAGVYIHQTQLTDDMGITFIKSGEVLLIR